ncbi:hypothetical protein B0O99DRAFT_166811 [Bisporella sp. PMI_857]|nr:hypothetical protein B0O99DRAFT_166811 [Bisporella sp. PMI_857]
MGFAPAAVPVVITTILFTSIAFIVVSLRICTRVVMLKNAGADDYLMLASMLSSIGFAVVVFMQIKYGLGSPFASMPQEHLTKFLQCLWATIPVYNLALTFSKLSIICQYMRIFTQEKVVKLCKIMLGILVVYGLWTVIGSACMCMPVSHFWDLSPKGSCMNKLAFWFSNAALNITTDIMIFAIPMPLLKQLQLPKRQKIGLMFVFGFGAFVCVTSVIRLKALYEISVATDTALEGVNAAIWSGIEINVAIACASLPSLKPLIGKILPGFLSTTSSRDRSNMNYLSDERGSHQLSNMRSKARETNTIKVEQTIYQTREVRGSLDSSEKSLVWKTEVGRTDAGSEQKPPQQQQQRHLPLETV